ncbi:MAG: hypothetical protein AB7T01_05130 [Acidithiobacillus sp.]
MTELHFSTVQSCRDTRPVHRSATWGQFAGWLQRPRISNQKDGVALIFATFSAPHRSDRAVSACAALAFDLEAAHEPGSSHPEAPEALHQRLVASGVAHVLWTTFSHVPAAPRLRLVLPVSEPFAPRYLADALALVAQRLDIDGVRDHTCTNPSRLMYAPACHPDRQQDYRAFAYLDAAPIDMGDLLIDVLDLQEARQAEEEERRVAALQAAQARRLDRRISGESGALDLIHEYNQRTSIADALQQAGYRQKGRRWISPVSHSGMPGVTIIADGRKAWSFHEGDPLNNGHPNNAWDVAVAYQFNGDRAAAVRALKEGKL